MTRPETPADHVTPYDRLAWSDTVVEHLLASGEHARELMAYFGAGEYESLAALAGEARRVPVQPDAPRVFIVPGIMGSQLGRMRRPPLPNDILWLDPVDISLGQLALLRLPVEGSSPVTPDEHKHVPMQGEPQSPQETEIVSLGVVLYTYLRLKLHLRIAGFAPVFHDYDWRLGVDEVGRALAERIRSEKSRVMIVGHSMGGLVSRAAMSCEGMSHVERVVLLGTPNRGSYAPVLALRGVYAVVRKIARLSQTQTAESLADEVFSTFPSLYHLLPLPNGDSEQDLFDAAAWPDNGPTPNVPLLTRAREVLKALTTGDERFVNIVGAGQETVTRATRKNGEFIYTVTRHGDGTVPVTCAELPGVRTYYTAVSHSELARDAVVAQAVVDVLRDGVTAKLQDSWSRVGKAEARISDTQLRQTHTDKVDFAQMEPEARQAFLRNLNEPPHLKLSMPKKVEKKAKASAMRERGKKAAGRASTPKQTAKTSKPSKIGKSSKANGASRGEKAGKVSGSRNPRRASSAAKRRTDSSPSKLSRTKMPTVTRKPAAAAKRAAAKRKSLPRSNPARRAVVRTKPARRATARR